MSPTKEAILSHMKRNGVITARELTEQLGISAQAVHRHMKELEANEQVEIVPVPARKRPGRPIHRYGLSQEAQQRFPSHYDMLALELIECLQEQAGEESVQQLFERRKNKLQEKYKDAMSSNRLPDRLAVLVDMQNKEGYMASFNDCGNDTYEFYEANCPIAKVSARYKQACACELSLFRHLLSAKVERVACIADGGPQCRYVIKEV